MSRRTSRATTRRAWPSQDAQIIRNLIETGHSFAVATGNSMAPIYGHGSTLKVTYAPEPEDLEPGTTVYFHGTYGFNRHMLGGFVDLPLGEDETERYAVIVNGDGSLDQLIPVGNIIGVVDVINNTLIDTHDLHAAV